MKHEKTFIIIFIIIILLSSCNSTRVFSGNTAGTREHRELENDIRSGETELAIAGTELKSTSKDIEESVNGIESAGNRLEQEIAGSEKSEQEITDIIQSIRRRKLPDDFINELKDREAGNIIE